MNTCGDFLLKSKFVSWGIFLRREGATKTFFCNKNKMMDKNLTMIINYYPILTVFFGTVCSVFLAKISACNRLFAVIVTETFFEAGIFFTIGCIEEFAFFAAVQAF